MRAHRRSKQGGRETADLEGLPDRGLLRRLALGSVDDGGLHIDAGGHRCHRDEAIVVRAVVLATRGRRRRHGCVGLGKRK